mgnify:CR=1 FL=1
MLPFHLPFHSVYSMNTPAFTHVVKVGTNAERHAVFAIIKWSGDGRLSITGVVGPRKNGDAYGSCGQCVDDIRALNPELADVWERWHLNDMRAGCEHQRADKWDERPIDPSKPTNVYGRHCGPNGPETWNMLAWVRRNEHPEGLMNEPCPACGYRYGTAWLREDVPADVVQWLHDLPTSDDLPTAWWPR